MQTLVLVIHLMLAIALIGLVLMQRSEGGALGIGGGTPFMGARAAGNALSRATAVLAAGFMLTSLALTLMARHGNAPRSILDEPASRTAIAPAPSAPAGPNRAAAPPAPAGAPAPQTPTAPVSP